MDWGKQGTYTEFCVETPWKTSVERPRGWDGDIKIDFTGFRCENGTGSGSCPVRGFVISGVEQSYSVSWLVISIVRLPSGTWCGHSPRYVFKIFLSLQTFYRLDFLPSLGSKSSHRNCDSVPNTIFVMRSHIFAVQKRWTYIRTVHTGRNIDLRVMQCVYLTLLNKSLFFPGKCLSKQILSDMESNNSLRSSSETPFFKRHYSKVSSAEVKNAWSYTSTPPIRLHGVVLS
jgi:hypothetical protein